MNFSTNYYEILGINHKSTDKEIRSAYYDKSKIMHPDKGGSEEDFKSLVESYKIMTNKELREKYDNNSKFGRTFDELFELLNFEFSNQNNIHDKDGLEKFKKNEILDIVYDINENFNGNIEYERWIICKTCNGTGGVDGKFMIKDSNGRVISSLQTGDECDFCEATGKQLWDNNDCTYCNGKGKFNCVSCNSCNGERRILFTERFKISPNKIKGDKHKVDFRGNQSKNGKVGHLYLRKI